MINEDPTPFTISTHNQEGKEQSGQRTNAQKHSTHRPGDLLPEKESPLHWSLKIKRTGHQEELENNGGPRLWSLVEEWHALLIPLRPNRQAAV